MDARSEKFEETAIRQALSRSSDFLLNLYDPKTGGFRFALQCPPSLMATTYCILGLEFDGALSRLTVEKRRRVVDFIRSARRSDGQFSDALFREADVLSGEHDRAYFEEETTGFCLQALDALGESVPALHFPAEWERPQGLVSYLKSLSWKNPWLDSNRVMFALSRICYAAERQGQSSYLAAVDEALEWLDTQQSEQTGLWHGREQAEMSNAMAATVHFTFFYLYRRRPIHFAERVVDSCLSLQASHGLFGGAVVGHTCFDYDALQLLYTMKSFTNHRKNEVEEAMCKAAAALGALQNADGGFADAKVRVRSLLGRPLSLFFCKKMEGQRYNNCLAYLSCGSSESNAYSTWLRSVLIVLTETKESSRHSLRSLPFLGHFS